jgi:DNA-binding GntR family transcriptional regulator
MTDPDAIVMGRQESGDLVHADLTQQTYRVLRDRILRRQIEPGAKISVDAVAEGLGVSRTPVTDALKRLAADGLLQIVPRRGTFVTGISAQDAIEMFDVRRMIELFAADWTLASGQGGAAVSAMSGPLAGMDAANGNGTYDDYDAFIDHDRLFHRAIVSTVGNGRLLRMYDEINVHMFVARAHFIQTVEAVRDAQAEHRTIFDAFAANDAARAGDALRAHIDGVRDRIVAIIERHRGPI